MTSRDHLKSLSDAQLIEKLRAYEYSHLMQEAADRLEQKQKVLNAISMVVPKGADEMTPNLMPKRIKQNFKDQTGKDYDDSGDDVKVWFLEKCKALFDEIEPPLNQPPQGDDK